MLRLYIILIFITGVITFSWYSFYGFDFFRSYQNSDNSRLQSSIRKSKHNIPVCMWDVYKNGIVRNGMARVDIVRGVTPKFSGPYFSSRYYPNHGKQVLEFNIPEGGDQGMLGRRNPLYIEFAEIDFDTRTVAPAGYEVNFTIYSNSAPQYRFSGVLVRWKVYFSCREDLSPTEFARVAVFRRVSPFPSYKSTSTESSLIDCTTTISSLPSAGADDKELKCFVITNVTNSETGSVIVRGTGKKLAKRLTHLSGYLTGTNDSAIPYDNLLIQAPHLKLLPSNDTV